MSCTTLDLVFVSYKQQELYKFELAAIDDTFKSKLKRVSMHAKQKNDLMDVKAI